MRTLFQLNWYLIWDPHIDKPIKFKFTTPETVSWPHLQPCPLADLHQSESQTNVILFGVGGTGK